MHDLGVGFSFNGIHSDDMGVILGNNDEVMHAISSDFSTDVTTVDGYDGGYPAGTKEGPKVFRIELICEDITTGQLAKIGRWLGRGVQGRLIFDHCPYKYYNATVTSGVTPPVNLKYDSAKNLYVYSGKASVELTAFYPRAQMVSDVLTEYPDVGTGKQTLEDESAIIQWNLRPAINAVVQSSDIDMYLLNQGNATAKGIITVSGIFNNGIKITNITTGQSMTVTAPDSGEHSCSIDSLTGNIMLDGASAAYIKEGHFIELAPGLPAVRNFKGTKISHPTLNPIILAPYVATQEEFRKELAQVKVGQQICINTDIYTISQVNASSQSVYVTERFTPSPLAEGAIVSMNKIKIEPGADTNATIFFYYNDTFY